jgi:hypothetical protein
MDMICSGFCRMMKLDMVGDALLENFDGKGEEL